MYSLKNKNNFKDYNTYIITQEEYVKTREERINYLLSCGIPLENLEENIDGFFQEKMVTCY